MQLQPVRWFDGWPLMGEDINGDGIGEPVLHWEKPKTGAKEVKLPFDHGNDDFSSSDRLALRKQEEQAGLQKLPASKPLIRTLSGRF